MSTSGLEKLYADMREEDFSKIKREELREDALPYYDREFRKRNSSEWKNREVVKEAEIDAEYESRMKVKFSRNINELDTKNLEKLYSNSRNVRVLSFIWGVNAIACFGSAIMSLNQGDAISGFCLAVGGLVFLTTALKALAGRWRSMGKVLSFVIMIGFPIGTIFGIYGLIAYSELRLFEPNRLTHDEIKDEVKRRK